MPLLLIVALGFAGFAAFQFRRIHRRRVLEYVYRDREATWRAAVHEIEMRRAVGSLEPKAEPLQRVKVG